MSRKRKKRKWWQYLWPTQRGNSWVTGINAFWLLTGITTFATISGLWIEFFDPEKYFSIAGSWFCLVVLTCYVVMKEWARYFHNGNQTKRLGGIWLYIWVISTLAMLLVEAQSRHQLKVPIGAIWIAVGVVINFTGSRMSLMYYRCQNKAKQRERQLQQEPRRNRQRKPPAQSTGEA